MRYVYVVVVHCVVDNEKNIKIVQVDRALNDLYLTDGTIQVKTGWRDDPLHGQKYYGTVEALDYDDARNKVETLFRNVPLPSNIEYGIYKR